jgi:asparagine synthase (glutamine-hydrolysing)
MKGFFDFLVSFHSETPPITRLKNGSGSVETISGGSWQASVNRPASCSPLASSLVHEKKVHQWHVWLLGELFGYRDAYRDKNTESPFDSFCADLSEGRVAPKTLNGHFLIVAWDARASEWHVWTNRMGTIHAYYASDGKRAALGTFFPAVAMAASRRKLDWIALTGFFGFGFFPQDLTYFDDVKILRPATHSVLDESGRIISQSRYWDWWYEPDEKRSYDDAVAHFGETLRTILNDQTRVGQIAVPISSGLDSRTAAAVITSSDKVNGSKTEASRSTGLASLWSYSYGYTSYSNETATAALIAAARNLPFQKYVIPGYLFDRLEVVLASVEGFQDVTSTRQAAMSDEIASHSDFLLAAHWGDVWMDDMGLLNEDQEKAGDDYILDHALLKIQKRGRRWLLENLCRPRLGSRQTDSILRDLVHQELKRIDIKEADFHLKAFKTEQWSFRWTVPSLRMFQPAAFPRLPFYDNRMVDFCCTVPSGFVSKRRLQIEYLKRFHPDLARIPWEVTGLSLFSKPPSKAWELSKRGWKKVWRGIKGKPHVGRNWEVQFLNARGKAGLREWLLRSGLKVHEYVSPKIVSALLEDLLGTPNAENGYSVSSLLTFSAWLERYG